MVRPTIYKQEWTQKAREFKRVGLFLLHPDYDALIGLIQALEKLIDKADKARIRVR